jgi:MFS family permease
VVLQEDHYGLVWTVSAALALVAVVLGCFTRETRQETAEPVAGAPRPKLFHRSALAPGVVLFLGMIGLSGYTAFVSLYVEETGIGSAGIVLGVYGVVVLVVRIVGARLPDRLGPLVAGTFATGVGALGLLIVGVSATPVALYVGTIVFAIGMSQLYPAMMILVLTGVPDEERSSAVGTVSSFFDGATSFGAVILGGIAALSSYQGAFIGGAVASLLALVLLRSGIDPRVRRPVDADAATAAHEVPEIEVP